ncbi:MAG: acetyl-CoA carboxylase biotin carboxyl carrier protein [Magnetococcales bacterium]|nr:acetyl-CoA carboxylase biotin carboxyl carrier protein [Magnetococcales bacterium]NGZ27727.1 acetyl-CoA carboxylase biotin carboxyl carrier protein [Magnetococcales bacterium]
MDLKDIRQLIRMLDDTLISEIEIKNGEDTLRITRAVGGSVVQPVYQPMPMMSGQPTSVSGSSMVVVEKPEASAVGRDPNTVVITSPMVGTFYRSRDPESPPLIQVGDMVEKRQPLAIIEAMKLMNEIESEYSGRIVAILKENASLVEYGEELFIISPM